MNLTEYCDMKKVGLFKYAKKHPAFMTLKSGKAACICFHNFSLGNLI